MPTSSQLRNALAYMSITVLVLVFLNIYSARATRDLMFKAKCSSSQDKLKVVTSSFSGVDALTQETTEQIISVIGDMNVTRLLVTDAAGRTLYDSVPGQSAAGKMVLLQQVVQALEGNDVFCCVYEDHTLKSYAAAPILTHDTVVGCVYMMEYDASQGGIIAAAAATDFQDKYDIQHIATLGSPIANFEIPEKTRVTAIEMDDEGIAALDGEANPHTENWLTIRCSVHEEDAPKRAFPGAEVSDSSGEKNSTHYPKYHEAGYRYAYDTGSKSVLDHDRHFQEVVEGELEEVQYYEGRISK